MPPGSLAATWLRRGPASVVAVLALTAGDGGTVAAAVVPPTPAVVAAPPVSPEPPLPVIAPPADLPVVVYWPSPTGFPADPESLSTKALTEGVRPVDRIAAYDGPGGQPLAYLEPTISGVEITLPIIERRSGWLCVLLPSVNRSVAWLPPGGSWTTVALRDQLIVVRSTHELRWLRDGALTRTWPVTLGLDSTPTPLGRTFVLGRSTLSGDVYADTDVFALAAVPDNVDNVPPGLRGAHIGLHTWYHDEELGLNTTDGCIRLTKSGHQLLLSEIVPGTEVLVVDSLDQRGLPG